MGSATLPANGLDACFDFIGSVAVENTNNQVKKKVAGGLGAGTPKVLSMDGWPPC